MVQLQALNYILKNKDVDLITTYDEGYFNDYKDEYNFILEHYKKYKSIPDSSTVLEKFNEFSIIEVGESKEYLEQKLYEEFVYNNAVNIINSCAEDFSKDAIKARDELVNKLISIKAPVKSSGIDIIANAQSRYDKFIDKQANQDKYFFSTGLNELDMTIGGLQRGEELIVIFARTNNCKSWIAEKLAVSVWEKGNNVGFFSPEMTADSVGYRFDTLYKNFDNKGVQGSVKDFDSTEYKKYITNLSKNKNEFNVTTPIDFNREVTVTALKKWIKEHDLKMIVIDGLTYMINERPNNKHQNTTERLTDISEDLMTLSVELSIPIIVVVQANRSAARDKDGDISEDAPELDTIRGSDGISHNASKVISVVHRKDTTTLYINKNRNGAVGQKLIYNHDVNLGKFTYMDNPKSGITITPPDNTTVGADGADIAKAISDTPTDSSWFNDSTDIF